MFHLINERVFTTINTMKPIVLNFEGFYFLISLVIAVNLYFRKSFSFAKNGLQVAICFAIFVAGSRQEIRELIGGRNCKINIFNTVEAA